MGNTSTRVLLFMLLVVGVVIAGCTAPQAQCPTGLEGVDAIDNELGTIDDIAANLDETTDDTHDDIAATPNIPTKTATEGELVSFPNLAAKDPEGDQLQYTFSAPLNSKGEWQTKKGDAGEYNIIIKVSDGKNTISQFVRLIVLSSNRAPAIAQFDDVIVSEGDTITLSPAYSDPDGDTLTATYTGWMNSSSRVTSFDDEGKHSVTLTVSDGTNSVNKTATVLVKNTNRAPAIVPFQDFVIKETDKITIFPRADDPDGDKVTFTIGYPFNVTTTEKATWTTAKGNAGSYRVNITASDGWLTDSQSFFIVVNPLNLPPDFGGVFDFTVDEGQTAKLQFTVSDPENDPVNVTISGWMTSMEKPVGYDEQGTHDVFVKAMDGYNTVERTIIVTVRDVNRPPQFNPGAFS